ncbi:MAG: histidine phosphatase family protein [Acidobacteriota bacterium]
MKKTRIILVRHGQASAGTDDYDRLSPVGVEQSRRLGESWADSGLRPDAVFAGPLLRHRQTEEAVAAVFEKRSLPWPAAENLDALCEHQAMELVSEVAPRLAEEDEEIAAWGREIEAAEAQRTSGGDGKPRLDLYFRIFREVTRRWVRDELGDLAQPFESWPAFRRRVAEGVQGIARAHGGGAGTGDGRTLVAFTSGGPVAASLGHALGLDDEKVLELSWIVHNTGCTDFLVIDGGIHLRAFNTLPHGLEGDLLTFV